MEPLMCVNVNVYNIKKMLHKSPKHSLSSSGLYKFSVLLNLKM